MVTYEQIRNSIESPKELEALYRSDPDGFRDMLVGVHAENPDSKILEVWYERLFFGRRTEPETEPVRQTWAFKDVIPVIVLSLLAGTLVKLPDFVTFIDSESFYQRNIGSIIITALAIYYLIGKTFRPRLAGIVAVLCLVSILFLNLLPDRPGSQTVILSCLHMPFFFWSLLGIAFMEGQWRQWERRMDYIRYNGDLLIYTMVILAGGAALTFITVGLFELIEIKIEDWYFKNVVVYGAVASPIVGTFIIDKVIGTRLRIAPVLAGIFTPLFLLTSVAYLLAMVTLGKSPYTDRDFLIVFNFLLLLVLGLVVFSVSARKRTEIRCVSDYLNILLVAVTLVIDIVALSAILFRLSHYGFTPNRIAVLGANLVVFGHLTGILWFYGGFIMHGRGFEGLIKWIAAYLPIYVVWSLIVAFGFPIVFLLG